MLQNSTSLDTTFAALADPTRRAILARLSTGEASVTELAQPFAISQPAVSRHLKVLESAGLISRGRDAQWRPAKLEAGPLEEVADWLSQYEQFWDARRERNSSGVGDYARVRRAEEARVRRMDGTGASQALGGRSNEIHRIYRRIRYPCRRSLSDLHARTR